MNALKNNRLGFIFFMPFLLITLLNTAVAYAQEDVIRKRFETHVAPSETLSNIKKTPFADLYEVQIGNDIVYTDSKAGYLFIGRIYDIETRRDFTTERMEEINRISFSDLPLNHAIKIVNGKGQRSIAVFSDPNCIYCKQLDAMLKKIDNITIYVLPLNILSEKSRTVSRNIWCSPDRAKAWTAWMTENKSPRPAESDCVYRDTDIAHIAKQYGITGTPVIIFQNGSRITGLPPIERFNEILLKAN